MPGRYRLIMSLSFIAIAACVFVFAACLDLASSREPAFGTPTWSLSFESGDLPTEKDFTARYRVIFEDSTWKKDDPDKTRILGTVMLEMDGQKKQVSLRQTNLINSYFEKSLESYRTFAYVHYDWVLKGDSPIKNDGVYLSKWVPVTVIKFPFKVGDSWDSGDIPEIWGVAKKKKYAKTYFYTVTGEEEVTVPAGTFRCLRVCVERKYGEGSPDEARKWEKTVTKKWYAEGVGVVRFVSDDPVIQRRTVGELVEFSRGPDKKDCESPALTEIKASEIPFTPGQVSLWQIGDNVFAGCCVKNTSTLEFYGGVWEGEPRTYSLSIDNGAVYVEGPPISLFETGKVYDFPFLIGKSWETGTGTTRKVVRAEIATARLIAYLTLKVETRRGEKLVAEEWIAPGIGPVKRVVFRPDGTTANFELELFLEKTGDRAEYILPWRMGESYGLSNPFGIGWSERGHKGAGRFSYDWGMQVGIPLVAARAGIVVAYREDSVEGGVENKQLSSANFLIIRHDDDSLGHYLHLDTGSVLPVLGDRVEQGELIARSGNTGWTSGPHLHFSVTRGDHSVPFAFRDTEGRFGLLEWGKQYTRTATAPGD